MFLFKRKKIVIDALTDNFNAYQHFTIRRSANFLPDWWRSLPMPESHTLKNKFTRETNMRHCTGMVDIYRLCHILPMWTELRVIVDPVGEPGMAWQFADAGSMADVHPEVQRGNFMPEKEYSELKLMPPWVILSKESVVWSMFQPTYSFERPDQIMVLPGMVDFQWDNNVNVQLMFKRQEKHSVYIIDPGQPLMAMLPRTDREVEIRSHHVTQQEMWKYQAHPVKLNGTGMHLRKLNKRCPVNHAGGTL